MTLAKVIRSACYVMVAATAAVAADGAVPFAGDEDASVTAERGEVVQRVTERGTLEPAEFSEIICRLSPRVKDGKVATTIKWVIEEGTFVEKGQRLIELDDSDLQKKLQRQRVAADIARTAQMVAEGNLTVTKEQNESDIRTAERRLEIAKQGLKLYTGDEGDRKKALELRVREAERGVERTRKTARAKEEKAAADLRAKIAVAKGAARVKQNLEAEIPRCVIRAPREGLLLYHTPEPQRFGSSQQPVVAEGEPVYAGQKLFRICDPGKLVVVTRVDEAVADHVRPGQKATVYVDAFPDRPLGGEVLRVANAPSRDWLSPDVKVYATSIGLRDQFPGLKIGMSAEVQIEVDWPAPSR